MAAVTESKDGDGDASAKKLLELGVDREKEEAVATGPRFLQKFKPVDPTMLGLPEDFDFSTAANEFKLVRYDALAFKRLSAGNDRTFEYRALNLARHATNFAGGVGFLELYVCCTQSNIDRLPYLS